MVSLYYTTQADNLHDTAHALLAFALEERGIREVSLTRGEHGKPFLKEYPTIRISLSHVRGLAACAVAEEEIGMDVQDDRGLAAGRLLRIAERFFAKEEADALFALRREEEMRRFFFRLWSAKEAYVKYTGKGMAEDFSSFRADPVRGLILRGNETIANLTEVSLPGEFFCTVCAALRLPVKKIDLTGQIP